MSGITTCRSIYKDSHKVTTDDNNKSTVTCFDLQVAFDGPGTLEVLLQTYFFSSSFLLMSFCSQVLSMPGVFSAIVFLRCCPRLRRSSCLRLSSASMLCSFCTRVLHSRSQNNSFVHQNIVKLTSAVLRVKITINAQYI